MKQVLQHREFSWLFMADVLSLLGIGILTVALGPEKSLIVLGVLCILVTLMSIRLWPAQALREREHSHPVLPGNHPHLLAVRPTGTGQSQALGKVIFVLMYTTQMVCIQNGAAKTSMKSLYNGGN